PITYKVWLDFRNRLKNRVEMLDDPFSQPQKTFWTRVYRVTNWPLFIFNQLTINFAIPCAFGKTHSLTSFGCALGLLSDLAMCVALKRWLSKIFIEFSFHLIFYS